MFMVNRAKSNRTTFTLGRCTSVILYGTRIRSTPSVKYLGLTDFLGFAVILAQKDFN